MRLPWNSSSTALRVGYRRLMTPRTPEASLPCTSLPSRSTQSPRQRRTRTPTSPGSPRSGLSTSSASRATALSRGRATGLPLGLVRSPSLRHSWSCSLLASCSRPTSFSHLASPRSAAQAVVSRCSCSATGSSRTLVLRGSRQRPRSWPSSAGSRSSPAWTRRCQATSSFGTACW